MFSTDNYQEKGRGCRYFPHRYGSDHSPCAGRLIYRDASHSSIYYTVAVPVAAIHQITAALAGDFHVFQLVQGVYERVNSSY